MPAHDIAPSASYGQRLGAFLLDLLIVGLPGAGLVVLVALNVPTEIARCSDGVGFCEQPTDGGVGLIALAVIGVAYVVPVLYWSLLQRRDGQTVGKRAAGIRVVSTTPEVPMSAGQVFGRESLRAVMFFVLLLPAVIDHLWPLWEGDNRSLHDLASRTRVVRT